MVLGTVMVRSGCSTHLFGRENSGCGWCSVLGKYGLGTHRKGRVNASRLPLSAGGLVFPTSWFVRRGLPIFLKRNLLCAAITVRVTIVAQCSRRRKAEILNVYPGFVPPSASKVTIFQPEFAAEFIFTFGRRQRFVASLVVFTALVTSLAIKP